MKAEQWKAVLGFHSYEVSDYGRIRRDGHLLSLRVKNHRIEVNLYRNSKTHHRAVHRLMYEAFIGPIPAGMFIDHIDRNPNNNTLTNLRLADTRQNCWNRTKRKGSSRYKGVSIKRGKWYAQININGKVQSLGLFISEEKAAQAYDAAASANFGSYAHGNFI